MITYNKIFPMDKGKITINDIGRYTDKTKFKLGSSMHSVNGKGYKIVAEELYLELNNQNNDKFFLVGLDDAEDILGVTCGIIHDDKKIEGYRTLAFQRCRKIGNALFNASMECA